MGIDGYLFDASLTALQLVKLPWGFHKAGVSWWDPQVPSKGQWDKKKKITCTVPRKLFVMAEEGLLDIVFY